jgi:pyrroloquinoline quinone biosynthesis protein D
MAEPGLRRDTLLQVRPSVTSRQLDDELILLDLVGGEYFSLNPSGAAVWRCLERGLDLGAVDAEVAETWPVSADERWSMITGIAAELVARGLVERRR